MLPSSAFRLPKDGAAMPALLGPFAAPSLPRLQPLQGPLHGPLGPQPLHSPLGPQPFHNLLEPQPFHALLGPPPLQDPLGSPSFMELVAAVQNIFLEASLPHPSSCLFSSILEHEKPIEAAKAIVCLQKEGLLPTQLSPQEYKTIPFIQLILAHIPGASFIHPVELMTRCAGSRSKLEALLLFLHPTLCSAPSPQRSIQWVTKIHVVLSFINSGIEITGSNLDFSQQPLGKDRGEPLAPLIICLSQCGVLSEEILTGLRSHQARPLFASVVEKIVQTQAQLASPVILTTTSILCVLGFRSKKLRVAIEMLKELLALRLPNAGVLIYLTTPKNDLVLLREGISLLKTQHLLTDKNLTTISSHTQPLETAMALNELPLEFRSDDVILRALLKQPLPTQFVRVLLALNQVGCFTLDSLTFLSEPLLVRDLYTLLGASYWDHRFVNRLMGDPAPREVTAILCCLGAAANAGLLPFLFSHPKREHLKEALRRFQKELTPPPVATGNKLKKQLCLHERPDFLIDAFLCLHKEAGIHCGEPNTLIFYEALAKNEDPVPLAKAFKTLNEKGSLTYKRNRRKRGTIQALLYLHKDAVSIIELLSSSPTPIEFAKLLLSGCDQLPMPIQKKIARSQNATQQACVCLLEEVHLGSDVNGAAIERHQNQFELLVALLTLREAKLLSPQVFQWVIEEEHPCTAGLALKVLGPELILDYPFVIEMCADRAALFKNLSALGCFANTISPQQKKEISILLLRQQPAGNVIISCAQVLDSMGLCRSNEVKLVMGHHDLVALYQTLELLLEIQLEPLRADMVNKVLSARDAPGIVATRALVEHVFPSPEASLSPSSDRFMMLSPNPSGLLAALIQRYNSGERTYTSFEQTCASGLGRPLEEDGSTLCDVESGHVKSRGVEFRRVESSFAPVDVYRGQGLFSSPRATVDGARRRGTPAADGTGVAAAADARGAATEAAVASSTELPRKRARGR